MIARFRFTWTLLAFAVTLAIAFLSVDLLPLQDLRSVMAISTDFAELSRTLRSLDSILTMVRLALLGGLFLVWRSLIQFLTSMRVLSGSAGASLVCYRRRIFLWFLGIELMIGQRLIQHAVEFLSKWL